jgi:hypothetical protein
MKAVDSFYEKQEEPLKSCFLALRDIILQQDPAITHELKYGMPFFCYKGKMFCYLWMRKNDGQPYIGMVEGKRLDHPELLAEKRSRMKILLLDVNGDLPVGLIESIVQEALDLYRNGVVKIKLQ